MVHAEAGPLPGLPTFYVRNLHIQSEATLLWTFLYAAEVLRLSDDGSRRTEATHNLEFATRFCNAFDSYQFVVVRPRNTFERGWYFLKAFERRELELGVCRRCHSRYVRDACQVDNHECPQCKLKALQGSPGQGSRSAEMDIQSENSPT